MAAFPSLRGVHGTAAAASGGVLFAGFGGEISQELTVSPAPSRAG
jgi:hypothetical protein